MEGNCDNGGYNSGDFKRNSNQNQDVNRQDGTKLNEKAGEYIRELLGEKIKLDQSKFPLSSNLIDSEISKVQTTGRFGKDSKYVDVMHEKPVKVVVKVLVPVKEYPKFNFVGKLLGPKGNNMKQLQEETMCKMAVLGRGSMRDKNQEGDLRNSTDPKYAHLSDELHVEISALAPPAEAHARIAYALAEVKKHLIPDDVDMQRGGMRGMGDRGGPRAPMRPPPRMGHGPPAGRPLPPGPPPPRPLPPKNKVMSILDRARSAMETPYAGYDDQYGAVPEPPMAIGGGRTDAEYYGYEREHYFDDEPYYKQERVPEYKSSAREVGTRRPAPAQRHFQRATPYARAPK